MVACAQRKLPIYKSSSSHVSKRNELRMSLSGRMGSLKEKIMSRRFYWYEKINRMEKLCRQHTETLLAIYLRVCWVGCLWLCGAKTEFKLLTFNKRHFNI